MTEFPENTVVCFPIPPVTHVNSIEEMNALEADFGDLAMLNRVCYIYADEDTGWIRWKTVRDVTQEELDAAINHE